MRAHEKTANNIDEVERKAFFNRPFRIVGCEAASNALLMSRNTQQVDKFSLKLPSMRVTSFDPADSVDLSTQKSCWQPALLAISLNQVLGN
jgi:hypothetical protein